MDFQLIPAVDERYSRLIKSLTSGPSNDSGSGSGPSIAHLLDSYFDLMKDSILLKRSKIVSLCHSRFRNSDILLRRCMSSFEMSFPVSVRTTISPSLNILQTSTDDKLYVSIEYGSNSRQIDLQQPALVPMCPDQSI